MDRRKLYLPVLVFTALTAATGCMSAHHLRVDYKGFESAFADTSNREMLLNLARLQNHDPTYFFKMGQITESYRFNGTIAGAGNYIAIGTAGLGNVQGGGTPGVTFENDPSFQFIPVTDETNAQLLLKQIPAQAFYILYQQGWRIDQLLRLMVDRIEVTSKSGGKCTVSTYRNSPPMMKGSGADAVSRDPAQLSAYVTFLRIAAIAYGLQKHGDLILRGVQSFAPVDPNSLSASGPIDVEKAAEKNLSYETVNGKTLVGQTIITPRFYLIPPKDDNTNTYSADVDQIREQLKEDDDLKMLTTGDALGGFLGAMANGFTISGDASDSVDSVNPCAIKPGQANVHLILRSLIGVMSAAAQEQELFDVLNESDAKVPPPGGPKATGTWYPFHEVVPTIEQLPLLRIKWKAEREHSSQQELKHFSATSPLVEIDYRDTHYFIADPKRPNVEENLYWNRDVFRLITALTSQVTVDTSKYQVPDIIQLRSQ